MAVSEETAARLAAGVEAALEILGQSPALASLVERLENPVQGLWPNQSQIIRIVGNAADHADQIYAYLNEDDDAPSTEQVYRLASTMKTCLEQVGALLRGEDLDDTDQVRNAQAWQKMRELESDLRFSQNSGQGLDDDAIDSMLETVAEAMKYLRKDK